MALAAVRSKVLVLLLLIHCLLLLPLFVGVMCLVLDLMCNICVLFNLASSRKVKDTAGYFSCLLDCV